MKTGDSSNLNLLPSQAKFQAARMKLQEILRRYMFFALILWLTVVVLMIILYFGSNYILEQRNKKYQQILTDFQSNTEELVVNQLVKYRTKVLGQVLKNRYEYSVAFEKINSIFADKVKLSKFELDVDKKFTVKVIALDKDSVDYIEEKIEQANSNNLEGVKSINIVNTNYSIDDAWLITLEVVLK